MCEVEAEDARDGLVRLDRLGSAQDVDVVREVRSESAPSVEVDREVGAVEVVREVRSASGEVVREVRLEVSKVGMESSRPARQVRPEGGRGPNRGRRVA